MKILSEKLPTKIRVNNKIYDINYDFRTAIKTIECFEDEDLDYSEKIYITLQNIYKGAVFEDEDIKEAYQKAIKFLDLGKETNEKDDNQRPRIYSFSKDENYIFSGINSTHGINLQKEKDLHWWTFMSLFLDMGDNCFFSELIYYRKRKAEGKLTEYEKKKYNEIKDLVEIDNKPKINESKELFLQELRSGSR